MEGDFQNPLGSPGINDRISKRGHLIDKRLTVRNRIRTENRSGGLNGYEGSLTMERSSMHDNMPGFFLQFSNDRRQKPFGQILQGAGGEDHICPFHIKRFRCEFKRGSAQRCRQLFPRGDYGGNVEYAPNKVFRKMNIFSVCVIQFPAMAAYVKNRPNVCVKGLQPEKNGVILEIKSSDPRLVNFPHFIVIVADFSI